MNAFEFMKIFTRDQIEAAIDIPLLMAEIEKGFIYHSEKKVVTSPTGFLQFNPPLADVHIKSCALQDDDYYVIKVASGFYDNPKIGLPSSNGLMLLFLNKQEPYKLFF